mgnify:CR=1 FL=1
MEIPGSKWTLLITLALIWGSSFILMHLSLAHLSPFQLASLRIVSAGLFLLCVGFRQIPKIPHHKWKYIAITSLFGTFIPAFLFSIAQQHLSSMVSAILNSLTPLNTLIIGILTFGLAFKRSQFLGILVGFAGSALLIVNGAMTHGQHDYRYAFLLVIASLCYAINLNLIKKHLSDVNPLAISVGNFTVMFLPALVILFSSGFFNQVHEATIQTASLYVIVLGILGTGVANIIFFRLIQTSSPVFASSVTYLIPVVAFFWGSMLGESLTPVQFLGAGIILCGVYLSGRK